jgi:hypothetical protein
MKKIQENSPFNPINKRKERTKALLKQFKGFNKEKREKMKSFNDFVKENYNNVHK